MHVVAVALLGAVVALLALRIVPPVQHALGPATVVARGELGPGETTVLVPPLGTVEADTHISPIGIKIQIAEVDPGPLGEAVSVLSARRNLIDSLEGDLRATGVRVFVRLLIAGLIIGAIAAAVLPHRRRNTIIAGAAGGFVAVGASLALTAATFSVDAFEEPRFTGALERAPQVIAAVNRSFGSLDELRSRYETGAQRLSQLMTLVAEPSPAAPGEESTAILHISDIHSNPIGVEIANQLARQFRVSAVLDTGDVTSFGAPVESRIGDLIADISVPYLFVPGNHDSTANRRRLAQVPNVELLDGRLLEFEGLRIMGWPDPTFTAAGEVTTEEGNVLRGEAAVEVAKAVTARRPDVLAVHDRRLGSESLGLVPLIVAGHTHERSLDEEEGTTITTVGSTGATGLGSFLVEANLPYEAEVLYFRDASLIAIDYISFDALGGDFEVQRRTIGHDELATWERPAP